MSYFFSAIVTRDGKVLFCEEDSHWVIIQRAGLKDDFVRISILDGDMSKFKENEVTRLPKWYNRKMTKARCNELLRLIMPARKVYAEAIEPAEHLYNDMLSKFHEKTGIEAFYMLASVGTLISAIKRGHLPSLASTAYIYGETVAPAWNLYNDAVKLAKERYAESISTIEGYMKGG